MATDVRELKRPVAIGEVRLHEVVNGTAWCWSGNALLRYTLGDHAVEELIPPGPPTILSRLYAHEDGRWVAMFLGSGLVWYDVMNRHWVGPDGRYANTRLGVGNVSNTGTLVSAFMVDRYKLAIVRCDATGAEQRGTLYLDSVASSFVMNYQSECHRFVFVTFRDHYRSSLPKDTAITRVSDDDGRTWRVVPGSEAALYVGPADADGEVMAAVGYRYRHSFLERGRMVSMIGRAGSCGTDFRPDTAGRDWETDFLPMTIVDDSIAIASTSGPYGIHQPSDALRTTDGGRTWRNLLDLVALPETPLWGVRYGRYLVMRHEAGYYDIIDGKTLETTRLRSDRLPPAPVTDMVRLCHGLDLVRVSNGIGIVGDRDVVQLAPSLAVPVPCPASLDDPMLLVDGRLARPVSNGTVTVEGAPDLDGRTALAHVDAPAGATLLLCNDGWHRVPHGTDGMEPVVSDWPMVDGEVLRIRSAVTLPTSSIVASVVARATPPEGMDSSSVQGIRRSTDGGTTWEIANDGLGAYRDVRHVFRHEGRGDVVALAWRLTGNVADGPAFFASQDDGRSWRRVESRARAPRQPHLWCVDPHGAVFMADSDRVVVSYDAGVTIDTVTTLPLADGERIDGLVMLPARGEIAVRTLGGWQRYRTFRVVPDPAPPVGVDDEAVEASRPFRIAAGQLLAPDLPDGTVCSVHDTAGRLLLRGGIVRGRMSLPVSVQGVVFVLVDGRGQVVLAE